MVVPDSVFSHLIVSNSFATSWTTAHQAPLSMGFSWQDYQSGLPFLSPGDLPDPEIELKTSRNQLEGLVLVAWGQKSLFPHWLTLSLSQKLCGSDSLLLLWSGLYSGMSKGTWKMDASPSSPSWGNIPGKLFCYTLGGIREKDKSNKGLGDQFNSVAQSCPTLCDPMKCSTAGLPVHHQLLEFTQTHVHWVRDAIPQSHPLLSPSPPALNLSQHQGLFKWVIKSWPTLCDPMNRSTSGFPNLHYLPEFAQTYVHWDSDTTQPSHPLLSPSPPALNLS